MLYVTVNSIIAMIGVFFAAGFVVGGLITAWAMSIAGRS
jgi:hypothetical protein